MTGAARGIGRAIAERLASDGFDIVAHYYQEHQAVNLVKERLTAKGAKVCTISADFADPSAAEQLVPYTLDRMGRVDAVINNSGVTWLKPFTEMTPRDLDRYYHINFRAAWVISHDAAVAMTREKRGGTIVHITSVHQGRSSDGDAVYGTFKAALARATESMAMDLGRYGIRVNAVAPGHIQLPEKGKELSVSPTVIPLMRSGTVAEVANAVSWLVSDDASYVTGHILHVDGGLGLPLVQTIGPHGLQFI